ncbi:MAG: ATP-binding cassette domain-containing protein [Bacteroidota bacterium]
MEYVLQLEHITKAYRHHLAVDQVSFQVPKQSIFGLLGPNGAGKTSLIRIITTITRADSGRVILNGQPLNSKHPTQIGYMPEERGLYKKMKVGDHLLYLAQLKGLSKSEAKHRIQGWLEKFSIEDWWNKKIEELSKGMQQKIQFISTVVHRPQLLILDEPFSGLDPINTNIIKEEIELLRQEGASIIFSTHRMEQVEEICEHIVLINQGRNILEGRVQEVREQFKENQFDIRFAGTLSDRLRDQLHILDEKPNALTLQVDSNTDPNQLLHQLMQGGLSILGFQEILPTLNQIFIQQVEHQTPLV